MIVASCAPGDVSSQEPLLTCDTCAPPAASRNFCDRLGARRRGMISNPRAAATAAASATAPTLGDTSADNNLPRETRRPSLTTSDRSTRKNSKMRRPTGTGLIPLLLLAALVGALSLSQPAAAKLGLRHPRQATADGRPEELEATTKSEAETTTTTTTTATATATTTTTTTTAPTTTTTTAPTTTTTSAAPQRPTRPPPVNYTRVDELFNAVLEDSEVAQKWRNMDKTLKSGIGHLLKLIFPHIVSMASDAKVSGSCSGAILKWILNLKNMRTWAVQMLDAIGKPSAGLLEGSLTLFGNYRQCLNVRAPDEDEIEVADGEWREYFRGQYCVLQIKPPLSRKPRFYSLNSTISSLIRKSYKYYERNVYDDLAELAMAFNFVQIRADLCVPSLCSRDDIQRVADFLVAKLDFRARVQRCEIQPHEESGISPVDTSHLLWSMIFVILLLLVLVSTLTSMVLRMKKQTNKSKTRSLFTSMSVYRSLSHMRNVQLERINDSKPVVLYALRLLILVWIFLVSLTSQLNFQFLREMLGLRDLIMAWPLQILVNSTLQFDALILLTAFTYAYQNINSNLADLVKYNLSKYSRLMPSIMLMVALTIITPLLYPWRSPVWHDFVEEPAQVCKSSGFINLFFLQNLLSSSQICLPQTWLFCVELQLCLIAIPLVYLLNKAFEAQHGSFRLASAPTLLLLALALLGCLFNFHNVYSNQLPAAWFLTYPDKEDKELYFSRHLYKTWAHLSTFCVGLFTGHLCRCHSIETFSGRPYGRRCCNNMMWLSSSLLMGALIFSTHTWSLSGVSHLESPLLSATYAALAPLLWAIGMSMILFQLTVPNDKNQRSCLSELLTSDVNLVRLGRLSFLAYLINPYVNTLVYAVQEHAIFSSVIMLAHTFIGNLVVTYALAFLVSALVELPCRRLFKKLLIGSRRQSTNLDIIARQVNIRQQNQGPSRDSFLAGQAAQHNQQSRMMMSPSQKQQQLAAASSAAHPMIPLK